MRLLAIAFVLLSFTGCAGPATQAQIAAMQQTCSKYGFKRGTTSFAACVAQLDQNRLAQNQRIRNAIADGMTQTANDMKQNRPINCTSSGYGRTVYTNCY